MAIFRIPFNKTSTLYSENEIMNTGKDEILEVGSYITGIGERSVARFLVQVSKKRLEESFTDLIGTIPFSASINVKLAEASEIPTEFELEVYPVAQEWTNGTGKFNDTPVNTTGVSWSHRLSQEEGPWLTSNFPPNITGSFNPDIEGGGNWLTEIGGIEVENSQLFELDDNLDIEVDVTNFISGILDQTLNNNGFIVKLKNDVDFGESLNTRLRYFSNDTNSIYRPYLQLSWDDSTYVTGSLSVVDDPSVTIIPTNLKQTYFEDSSAQLRLTARKEFPERTFSTGSLYIDNNALPENSLWSLKDETTGETVIPFDEQGTKISCDEKGPFFNIYLQGLEPQRYYRIIYKVPVGNKYHIVDNRNIFQIVKYGK